MKTNPWSISRLIILVFILGGISFLWLLLGGTVSGRAVTASYALAAKVEGNWGPPLQHHHPRASVSSLSTRESLDQLLPSASEIGVSLNFLPQRKGLITHRTFIASVSGTYTWRNPHPVDVKVDTEIMIPGDTTRIEQFKTTVEDLTLDEAPSDGRVNISFTLPARAEKKMLIQYKANGKDSWIYRLGSGGKARNFTLRLDADFTDFNIPENTESPTGRKSAGQASQLTWTFENVTGVEAVGLEVPAYVDAARVAARMSFFGPLSLGLFFIVLVIAAIRMGVNLHPMHFVLLGAACFAFQLLFAYSVDVLPVLFAFAVAAATSTWLVWLYLKLVAGSAFARIALTSMLAYVILFNATFFFDGYTGLTLTVMGVITLGLIMTGTARIDWSKAIRTNLPPPLPGAEGKTVTV
ncbi:MAG: inner membrane CreD family protein [Verrucomicrobiaceae bacterium]|nr:inner membrane CreD family protein [Verrucomicrobiaceae bacterium]